MTAKHWEGQAENWIALARADHDSYWYYREFFFELVPEPRGRTVEIGCGEGRVSRDLKDRGHDVVGVDASPTLVAAACTLDSAGEYVVSDAAQLPFDDGAFDLAVAYNSLMDIDDMVGAVEEASRVLRPGGHFCICVTHPLNDAGRFEDREPAAAFHVDVYRGRRPYNDVWGRDGVSMHFVGWCYPLEGYTRPLEDAGFLLEAMREPAVDRSAVSPRGGRRLRIPNFLFLRAVKPA